MERAEISYLTAQAFEDSFLPGDRANLNFVSFVLYQFQDGSEPSTEFEQDIVWAAEKINPDRSTWFISFHEYELAASVVNRFYCRLMALS
jgi:hypothetical protein